MKNECMKIYSTIVVIREMKTKTTKRYEHTPTGMAKQTKHLTTPSGGNYTEELELS